MPIPSQNEFLLPFLTILNDGQPHTRGQILLQIAKKLAISEQEAQAMSGNQFTLVSRIAWCDVHFVKAGFVEKKQHPSDSNQDTFRITPLGVRELDRSADKLTVGYLQSFYRGKVYRGAGSDDTTSEAELALYEAFEKLPEPFKVIHSVKWFGKTRGTVGEVDFLIALPKHGVLVLEVKGGEISVERQNNDTVWRTRDRNGHLHTIKDPVAQADRNRWALRDWLESDPRTRQLSFAIFSAVALPDSRVDGDLRPDAPVDLFIDIRHLDTLEARLLDIFRYWESRADFKNARMDGQTAIDALIALFVPTRTLQPKVADVFERERRKIDELTHTQFRVLRQLRQHKRAAIVGGAGSGKTMLAMEKCQQLADGGFRVLFVCFNRGLADWVSSTLKHPDIVVSTFHSMVKLGREWAKLPQISNKDFDYNRVADYMIDTFSIIHSPDSGALDKLFDAVIIDESQDFEATWWIAVPDFLKEPNSGVLYLFFDNNQRLYEQIDNIPLPNEPFYLDENCRNTQHIHERMIAYARDVGETICEGPEGRPIELVEAQTAAAARSALGKVLHRMVNEQGVVCSDIVILTPAADKRSQWKEGDQIGNFRLTYEMNVTENNTIRVCTIHRFKGLESAVVILTELEKRHADSANALVYVGLSRARHHAIVIGELPPPVPFGSDTSVSSNAF